ncbi:hypothetical protein M885DRAFT_535223 [Pelagophyceae sp. CCMP2097]|nr:hypothetical protein M885DRAFT_535223 [Pelagophyceae sp. CCMP2097]
MASFRAKDSMADLISQAPHGAPVAAAAAKPQHDGGKSMSGLLRGEGADQPAPEQRKHFGEKPTDVFLAEAGETAHVKSHIKLVDHVKDHGNLIGQAIEPTHLQKPVGGKRVFEGKDDGACVVGDALNTLPPAPKRQKAEECGVASAIGTDSAGIEAHVTTKKMVPGAANIVDSLSGGTTGGELDHGARKHFGAKAGDMAQLLVFPASPVKKAALADANACLPPPAPATKQGPTAGMSSQDINRPATAPAPTGGAAADGAGVSSAALNAVANQKACAAAAARQNSGSSMANCLAWDTK